MNILECKSPRLSKTYISILEKYIDFSMKLIFKLQQVLRDSMQNNIFSNCLLLDSRPQFYEAYRGNETAVLMYFFTVLQNLSLMRRMSENLAIEKAREQAVSFVHL